MMSIREYIDCENQDLRTDYDEHVFDNVFNQILSVLPGRVYSEDVLIWTDGTEILCKTEWLAELIADMIKQIAGEPEAHTGYYDPSEDERDGCVDSHTGWYYVDFD